MVFRACYDTIEALNSQQHSSNCCGCNSTS